MTAIRRFFERVDSVLDGHEAAIEAEQWKGTIHEIIDENDMDQAGSLKYLLDCLAWAEGRREVRAGLAHVVRIEIWATLDEL